MASLHSWQKDPQLSIKLEILLPNENERKDLYSVLESYNEKQTTIEDLAVHLRHVVNLPERLTLFDDIRPHIRNEHQMEYNVLTPYVHTRIRMLQLKRRGQVPLGFAIRGGCEYGTGIFVSEVDSGSEGERKGLRVGDQIMGINGYNIDQAIHDEVLTLLRAKTNVILKIKTLADDCVKDYSPLLLTNVEHMDSRRSSGHLKSHLSYSSSAPLLDETTHFETTVVITNSWSPSNIQQNITDKEAQSLSESETEKFFLHSKAVPVERFNASTKPFSSSNSMFSCKEKATIYTADEISSQTKHGKNTHTEMLAAPPTSQPEVVSAPSTSQTELIATPTSQTELLEVHMMVKDPFATGKAVDNTFSGKMYSEDNQKTSHISLKSMATGGDTDSIYFQTNQGKSSLLTIGKKTSGHVADDDQPITDSRVPKFKIPQTYFDEHVHKPLVPVDSVRQHNRFISQDLSIKLEELALLSEPQNFSSIDIITLSTSDKEPNSLSESALSTPSNEFKSFNDINVSGCTDQTLLSVQPISRRISSESMKATNECNSNQLPDNSPLLEQLSPVKKKESRAEILSIWQESLSPKTSEKNLKPLTSTSSILMPSLFPSTFTASVSNNQFEAHSSSSLPKASSQDVPKHQLDKQLQTKKLNSNLQNIPTSLSATSSLARNLKSLSLSPLKQLILYFNNPVSKPLSSIISPVNNDLNPNSKTTDQAIISQPKETFYIDVSRNRVYNPKNSHSMWLSPAKITSANSEKTFEKSWSHQRAKKMPLVEGKVSLKELLREEETEGREIKTLVVKKKGPINISLKKGDELHLKDRILVSEIWPGDCIPLKGELQEDDEILMIENARLRNKSLTIANAALRNAMSNSSEYFQIVFAKRT